MHQPYPHMEPGVSDSHATEKSGKKRRRIFFGWYMVAASVATNTIFSAAYFQGFGVLIIPIERAFGWDRWVISAAMSLRQLESGIVSPAVGFLLDRFSARKLIFWSAVISGLGFIGLGFSTGIVTFFLFFVVISLGASGVSHAVTWPVIISRWFRRNRGLATGLAVTGPIFGSPLVILNTQIEEAYGWRVVLFGYGALILVGVTLLSMLVRDRPEPYGLRPDGDPPEESASIEHFTGSSPRRMDAGLTLRAVFRTKEFWLFTSYLSGTFAVNSAVQVHMIPYFQQDIGLTPTSAAVVMSFVFILSGIGRIGGGYLLDRMDYRLVLAVVAAMMGIRPVVPSGRGCQNGLEHIALRSAVRRQLRLPCSHAWRRRQHHVRHPDYRRNLGPAAGGTHCGGGHRPLGHGHHLRPERELLPRHVGAHRH